MNDMQEICKLDDGKRIKTEKKEGYFLYIGAEK